METNQHIELTKDDALKRLGVYAKKARNKIGSHVDLVHAEPGRKLITAGSIEPASLAGLTGSVVVTDRENNTFRLEAPFVIGPWACDDQRRAQFSVVALEPVSLIVTNWQVRGAVFAQVPRLSRVARTTHDAVTATAKASPTIPSANKPSVLV